MKKVPSVFFILIIVVVGLLFYRGGISQAEAIKAPVNLPQNQDLRSEKFEPARKMLREAGVPFDPDILLSRDWKNRIRPILSQMPEMRSSLRSSNTIRGVQIADTIILPEKVELSGDLVILTNTLVLEGRQTEITGLGRNVYVFPLEETFHLGRSFESIFLQRGYSRDMIPPANERIYSKLEFEGEKTHGSITVRVNGQGYPEWLERKKKNSRSATSQINGLSPEVDCLPQRTICVGEGGEIGDQGTGGLPSGIEAPPPAPGSDGICVPGGGSNGLQQNGIPGHEGDNGATGPDNAGRGQIGYPGGAGGNIFYQIPPPYMNTYHFDVHGGQGGRGGPGGVGAPGDPAQKGGTGGNGADCRCDHGGAGSGADGTTGGKGGAGGIGGRGGPGGPGGPGGTIYVEYPNDFRQNRIFTFVYGGPPGIGGEGGLGGPSGTSGEGGDGGRALGNTNCNSTQGRNGNPGIRPAPFAPSERGPDGPDGTVTGHEGSFVLYRLPPPPPAGGCGGFASFSLYPNTGCAPGFVNSGGYCTGALIY